jgi:hypothetical protein
MTTELRSDLDAEDAETLANRRVRVSGLMLDLMEATLHELRDRVVSGEAENSTLINLLAMLTL